jgi:hypothetical protein
MEMKDKFESLSELCAIWTTGMWKDLSLLDVAIAGGSPRFMFDYNVVTLRDKLEELIEKIKWDQWGNFASVRL